MTIIDQHVFDCKALFVFNLSNLHLLYAIFILASYKITPIDAPQNVCFFGTSLVSHKNAHRPPQFRQTESKERGL